MVIVCNIDWKMEEILMNIVMVCNIEWKMEDILMNIVMVFNIDWKMEDLLMNMVMEIYIVIEWKKMWSVFKFGDFVYCLLIVFFLCVNCNMCLCCRFLLLFVCLTVLLLRISVWNASKKNVFDSCCSTAHCFLVVLFFCRCLQLWCGYLLSGCHEKRFWVLWVLYRLFVLFASTDLQTTEVFGKLGWVPLKISSS